MVFSLSMMPKYAQVATLAAATMLIIFLRGKATSVFSFSFAAIVYMFAF